MFLLTLVERSWEFGGVNKCHTESQDGIQRAEPAGPRRSSQKRPERGNHKETASTTALIFIGVMVAFFDIAGLDAAFCEKL